MMREPTLAAERKLNELDEEKSIDDALAALKKKRSE